MTAILAALLLIAVAGCARQSPLVGAVQSGNADLAKTLLAKGVDPNQFDWPGGQFDWPAGQLGWHGTTALHVAAERNSLELVKLLVEHGADVNVRNRLGEAPLLLAIRSFPLEPFETVKYLVEHGADVNASSRLGETALSAAAANGDTRIVDFLLAHGAIPD